MARPTKLTPEVQDKVTRAIRAGNYANVAARAAGIAESTFYRWMELGHKEEEGIHGDFRDAVEEATAEAEVHMVALITKAAQREWRAALALLERRSAENWKRGGAPSTEMPPHEEPLELDDFHIRDRRARELGLILRRAVHELRGLHAGNGSNGSRPGSGNGDRPDSDPTKLEPERELAG